MGKIEVKGTASKTVEYDSMKIELNFHAREKTPADASEKVMRECEDFLKIIKERGFDISQMSLKQDLVEQNPYYRNDEEEEFYKASRTLEFVSKFNMKMINDLRVFAQDRKSQMSFHVDFFLSNKETTRQKLLMEALIDAKKQAQMMAEAISESG